MAGFVLALPPMVLLLNVIGLCGVTCIVLKVVAAVGYSFGLAVRFAPLTFRVATDHPGFFSYLFFGVKSFTLLSGVSAIAYWALALHEGRKLLSEWRRRVGRRMRVCWVRYHRPCTRSTGWLTRIIDLLCRRGNRFWRRLTQ